MINVSVEKILAAYRHFGSLRKAGKACGISKDTVHQIVRDHHIELPTAALPRKVAYGPARAYSKLAKWHKEHAKDKDLPLSLSAIAALAGVSPNVAKCYFQRRREAARKILNSLPDLRKLNLSLEDIEGKVFDSSGFESYNYAIDRYSQRAAIQGMIASHEVTVLIPSIEQFASRVRKS